jgi:Phage-related lysozyme (muraminidase)
MAKVWSTSPAGLQLIQTFEGCERRRPDGMVETYQVGKDLPTIGWGQTGQMPDGRPVVEGLTITQQEADDALMYFVRNVVDPLVRKHFVCQTQAEHDACASWVYNVNHSKLERGEYSLPRLVNAKHRDTDALVTLWMRYIHTPGFENGLYRRRLAEMIMFLGLPWNKPAVWGYVSSAVYQRGGVVQPTDPMFILDVAEQAAMTEDEITADLNNQQLMKLRGKPAKPRKAVEPSPASEPPAPAGTPFIPPMPPPAPEPAPNVNPALPPKPMEESRTHKGLSKAESGRETVVIGGTITGIGAILPQVQAITSYLSKFPLSSVLYTLVLIGVIVAIVGAWRWWVGRMMTYEGRQMAERTKV